MNFTKDMVFAWGYRGKILKISKPYLKDPGRVENNSVDAAHLLEEHQTQTDGQSLPGNWTVQG